jgi:subtilisin family serine protease
MKRSVILLLPLVVAACSDGRTDLVEPRPGEASLRASVAQQPYIVVLNPGARALGVAAAAAASPRFVYSTVLNGFAADLNESQLNALRNNPNVAYIEPDGEASINSTTQAGATWGIDRIDQTNLPLNGTYTYGSGAATVHAYVIDTGIRTDHAEFGRRAQQVYNSAGGKNSDCNGHGTHVAGTIGGATHGVAKEVQLYGIKVLGCSGSGTWSGIIAGMDWVAANHRKPAVANMSLGGGRNQAVNDATARLMGAGVYVVVAAGNSNADACNYSPAATPGVMTVAASTNTDAKASYSNWGSCVNLYAPGSSITSAWHSSRTATNTISGTSMASPHVAGVAALYKATHGDAGQAAVTAWLESNASLNRVSGNGSTTPNRLLFKSTL